MTTVRTAVIPAAGLGTRFLPATKAVPKEMLPVVDRPAIQYVVEEAVAAGITDVLIVTGRSKKAIEDHFDRAPELEMLLEAKGKLDLLDEVRRLAEMCDIHLVRQGQPLGLGHAVSVAARHVGREPFAVMLPDDLYHERSGVLRGMLEAFDAHGGSVVSLLEVSPAEISAYGAVAAEPVAEGIVRVSSVVEKPAPDEAPSNLAVVGRYVFTPEIFDALATVEPGVGGEIQLTDAIAALAADQAVFGYVFDWGRYDLGNKVDYLRAVVDLALERPDLGPGLRAHLRTLDLTP